jgi:hypothetical protein
MSARVPFLASLVVWWFLVVLPGILTLAGAFGDIGEDTEVSGSIVAVWLFCYLGQLAMVFVMQHAAGGRSHTLWFLVASLLPWVVDWGVPFGAVVATIVLAASVALAGVIGYLAFRQMNLDTHGTQVEATVIKVLPNYMNVVINSVYIRRRVRVQFTLPGGEPQQRTVHVLYEIGNTPSPGDHLTLRVDPKHPWHLALDPSEFSR